MKTQEFKLIYTTRLFAILVLPGFLLATGCSIYSKKECQSMNWHEQGAKFAQKGLPEGQARTHFQDACE